MIYLNKSEINYLKSIKFNFLLVSIIFIISVIIGFILYDIFPEYSMNRIENFQENIEPYNNMNSFNTMLHIFLNNSFISLIALILGILIFLLPILIIIHNGLFCGMVIHMGIAIKQLNILIILAFILPHGIFELAMVFLACTFGSVIDEDKKDRIMQFKIFLKLIIPLLLVASFIEVYITPIIGEYFI